MDVNETGARRRVMATLSARAKGPPRGLGADPRSTPPAPSTPGARTPPRRLRRRATEDEAAIAERLRRANEEAQAYPEYDYLIINADIEDSLTRLKAVVEAERLRVGRLREEFAPWKN